MAQVNIPPTAIVAFYLDRSFNVVATEILPRQGQGRQIEGVAFQQAVPTLRNPVWDHNQRPEVQVPENAGMAIYVDADSRIVAIEKVPTAPRKIRSIAPEAGNPPCSARCTVYGPNGAYCLPGCK